MKSNYEHFVLTASCLKADLWSAALRHVQGRPAWIFWAVTHPSAAMPTVPNHIQPRTVLTTGFWSYFCSWATGAWDKTSMWGPNCTLLKTRTCPSPHPVGLGSSSAGPPGLYLHRNPPRCKPLERGWPCRPLRGQPPGHGTGCRHRLHPPNHLPGFKARQVRLGGLGG